MDFALNDKGLIDMQGAKTIQRYLELTSQCYGKIDYNTVYSYALAQRTPMPLEEARKKIAGGSARMKLFLGGIEEKIREECDPQEIYNYEYNIYESYGCNGDLKAAEIIAMIFGNEVLSGLRRFMRLHFYLN